MDRMDLWHDIAVGAQAPAVIHAVVEIPRGHRNKYEYNKQLGVIHLSRVLFSPMHYPGDYGFIPQTAADDLDPLDVLVMVTEPTFPGCVIEVRPVGVFHMTDREESDDKILAVPTCDPLFGEFDDIADVPKHFLSQVSHFFQRYKELEGVEVVPVGWSGVETAHTCITQAMHLYKQTYG